MEVPDKIRSAALRLKEGHRVNRITVRDFLGHFGAARRGAVKVAEIRAILESLDIETDPDFEAVWIDQPIWLRLKNGLAQSGTSNIVDEYTSPSDTAAGDNILEATPMAVQQAEENTNSAPTSVGPETMEPLVEGEFHDPTFRIGSLPAANKHLVPVNRDDPITTALTLMIQHDFSQLPVMQGEREVKGIITWKSIAWKMARGQKCDRVEDCREDARIVDANRTLFDVVPQIGEHGYVLVMERDRKITGIVTASDLALHLHALTEPFLLLREVELHIRRLAQGKFDYEDITNLAGNDRDRGIDNRKIADLTLGDWVRLFEKPETWDKLDLRISRTACVELLNEIRKIRNEVMHFDSDPMTADKLATIKRAVRLMQELSNSSPR